MITAREVSLTFGGRPALRSVSLHVERGELVGLVGAASAGKSVLLKVFAGLLRPDAGAVNVDGIDLISASRSAISTLRGRLGFCFQNLALFDRLSTTGNVAYALTQRGVGQAEALERAQEQLRRVGLGAALEKMPWELSGGMKRRLALARALVSKPDVALLDDPFVGLDPVACARIARLIVQGHQESGGSTLVAAGDPAPLLPICSRIVLLENGEVVAEGAPSEFHAGGSEAIARYLGPGRKAS